MSKKNQSSIIEPTEKELEVFQKLIKNLKEEQLDEFANEYFELVREEKIKISFQKFVIDKMVRPIQEGDTVDFKLNNNEVILMFCLYRKEINNKNYLLFAKVDKETETLFHEDIYLFYVDGVDELGTEILDIIPNNEESKKILKIIEDDLNAKEIDKSLED